MAAGGDPGAVAVPVEVWGGLVTDMAAAALPHGVSPDCQDCKFSDGVIGIRPGLTSQYVLAGNPSINYLKTYTNLVGTPRLLSLDSLGNLRKDPNPGGAPLTLISSAILPGLYAKSSSLFGREYLAFGTGLQGQDIPRQYDDTNLDRVSQCGPGAAPQVSDENISFVVSGAQIALLGGTLTITGLSESNTLVTAQLGAGSIPGLVQVGDVIQVSGSPVAGYNGTWTVTNVTNAIVQFVVPVAGLAVDNSGAALMHFAIYSITTTVANNFAAGQLVTTAGIGVANYNGTFTARGQQGGSGQSFLLYIPNQFALGASGGGTAAPAGSIAAGKHQLSVFFVTRNNALGVQILSGYWTKPAPPTFWVAGGGRRAVVTNIPVGGPQVIARILCFTGAGGASFYHLGPLGTTIFSSNMYIADNTTTTMTIDFTDAVLLQGTLDDPLFDLIELPPVMGAVAYKDRTAFWGELNLVQALLNLSFDGGFTNAGSNPASPSFVLPNLPLGWTPDPVNSPGGASAIQQGQPTIYGDAYVIVGNGAAAIRGKVTQSAAVDYLNNPILLPNTAYSVRARIGKNATLAQGTVHINLKSVSGAFTTVGISQPAAQVAQGYQLFVGNLTNGLAVIPADLVLQVYADGTPTLNGAFFIDCIEIFPTAQPTNGSNVRFSKAEDPESFDSQTGLQQVALNDGDSVRSSFRIRERLYHVKDNSFHATQDDGVNEPSSWAIDPVSEKVGTPSVNGVGGAPSQGGGEDWVVIAHRTGLYLFWGGEPVKISQEIQPTWDTINWNFGWTLSVSVDTKKRRILVCAPFGAATAPNKTLVLDYHDVGGPDQIASSPPIHLTYTGRKTTFDKARKWCPWTISANSLAQVQTANSTTAVYFGSNDGTGNINLLDDAALNDNGAFIPQYYTTAGFVEQPMEQSLQLGPGRKLFTYLQIYATGAGTMGLTAYLSSPAATAIALNPMTLSNPRTYDLEMMLNIPVEKVFIKLNAAGLNQWFALQIMAVSVKPDPMAPVAGAPGAPNVAA